MRTGSRAAKRRRNGRVSYVLTSILNREMLLTDGKQQHNALRDYRTHNSDLQRQLKEHKESAAKAKSTYVEWNSDLQAKVTTLKKEKKTWQTETSTLRLAEKELRVRAVSFQFIVNHACCPGFT